MQAEPYPSQHVRIGLSAQQCVSGLMLVPGNAKACLVLAHGAGAGMAHPFMVAVAAGLYERAIASLRYQFPYMEEGSRRPDSPKVAQATVRAAAAEAIRRLPGIPLFAGGKSFGGRMTSQAQAETPLPNVLGLAFLGFPLHPAKKPSTDRGRHLRAIQIPMLFLQGTRDALADWPLIQQVTSELGDRATLAQVTDADHSFHVAARSGRTREQVMVEVVDALAQWIGESLA